jgi:hypothetical protein
MLWQLQSWRRVCIIPPMQSTGKRPMKYEEFGMCRSSSWIRRLSITKYLHLFRRSFDFGYPKAGSRKLI